MNLNHSPLIATGQVYLNPDLNEYLVVTRNNRGQIHYSGAGFTGQAEDLTFIERFQPVDPLDLDVDEASALFEISGSPLLTGYIHE